MTTAYLYAVDVLPIDGDLSNGLAGSFTVAGARRVFLMTNLERAVPFASTASFWSSFLAKPSDGDLVGGLPTFQPVAGISHSGVRLNQENNSGDLTLTLPMDHAVAQLFAYDVPAAQLWLTVYVLGDEPSPVVQWVGRIDSCEVETPTARLKCSNLDAVLARPGLTRKHPRTCGHTLYGPAPGCGVLRNAFNAGAYFTYREDGFLAEVKDGGLTLVVPEAANRADGWFTEGFIAIEPDYAAAAVWNHQPRATVPHPFGPSDWAPLVGGFRRHVTSHVGQELHLSAPLLAPLSLPARVSVWAGCDMSPETCTSKFNNFSRFGGYPYIPIKNAFESGIKD